MWEVRYHPAAEAELGKLPAAEQAAIRHAVEKLQAVGPDLGYPHSSQTKGIAGLRELRPRAGRSAWRAIYRRLGGMFVVAAIGPDGQTDPAGFAATCRRAAGRFEDIEEDWRGPAQHAGASTKTKAEAGR
jgi:hypothetical protein